MPEPIGKFTSPTEDYHYAFKFGKHYGESIEDVPNTYILWCLENLDEEEWREVVTHLNREYARRETKGIYIEDEFEMERGFRNY